MVLKTETFWVVRFIKDTPVQQREHEETLPSRHGSWADAEDAREASRLSHMLEVEERTESWEEEDEDDES